MKKSFIFTIIALATLSLIVVANNTNEIRKDAPTQTVSGAARI